MTQSGYIKKMDAPEQLVTTPALPYTFICQGVTVTIHHGALLLKSLKLSSDQLQAILMGIKHDDLFLEVEYLSLGQNQLRWPPNELWRLVNLTNLFLDNNQLQSVPAEIGELINLCSLNLSDNSLQTLPAEIGKLINLKFLYLYGNPLQSLPVEIAKLKLKELGLGLENLLTFTKLISQMLKCIGETITENWFVPKTGNYTDSPDWPKFVALVKQYRNHLAEELLKIKRTVMLIREKEYESSLKLQCYMTP